MMSPNTQFLKKMMSPIHIVERRNKQGRNKEERKEKRKKNERKNERKTERKKERKI